MVIPFAAGGPTDVLGRVMAQRMGEVLGQTVIVENIGGAGGMTGGKRVADAKPDGYTMLLGTVGTQAQGQTLYKHPLYNAVTDFTPVGADRRRADRADRAQGPAGQQSQGIRRLRQGQPGQDAIRLGRRRLGDASRLRRAQYRDGHRHRARAVQGHRPGDAGPDRRPHRFPVRDHQHGQAADRRRQRQGVGDHDQGALAGRCRTWPTTLRAGPRRAGLHLERAVSAEGRARRRRQEAQRGDDRGDEHACGAGPPAEPRRHDRRAGPPQPGISRQVHRRAKSRSGKRRSRRAACRSSKRPRRAGRRS